MGKYQIGIKQILSNLMNNLYTILHQMNLFSRLSKPLLFKGYSDQLKCNALILTSICLMSITLTAVAVTDITLTTEKLSSDDWTAEEIRLSMNPTEHGLSLKLNISRFEHKSLPEAFTGIEFNCPLLQQEIDTYHCSKGGLLITDSPYGSQQVLAEISYTDAENFSVSVDGLTLAEGVLNLSLVVNSGDWQLSLDAQQLTLESLTNFLNVDFPPKDWAMMGSLSLKAELSGSNQGLQHIVMAADIAHLNYADQDGLQVSENGAGRFDLSANLKGGEWFGSISANLKSGQFYSDPIFLDLNPMPLHLKLNGQWSPAQDVVQIEHARIDLLPAFEAQGMALIDLSKLALKQAKLQIETHQLDQLYTTVVQPIMIGTMVDELTVSGEVQAEVELSQGSLNRLHATLKGVDLDDKRGVFALVGVDGTLDWSKHGGGVPSHIEIEKGHIYQIPYASISVDAQAEESGISLLKPIDIPLLGGHIHIAQFESHSLLSDSPVWETSAKVNSLSLQELASAFEWPSMSGELNGELPAMRYHEQTLKLDGAIQVDVFGGHIRVDQLKVKQPLGRVPEMYAAAELNGLDLEQITQTFSFGHIEGGLDGQVRALHLLNWEPVAFDALFHSPDKDNLPHRISQRAVDNLTSIGNGVGSGLQSTFLGIFKEFRYNRIQLSAKLDGNLAELDGIEHPDGGYYLVKGAGLPRIDVIARNRRVAWKTLLERLKNIRVEGMEVR